MDGARKRADEGYVEDVARAVAAMLRRRPVVSATALVAGIAVTKGDWVWLDPALFRAWVTSAAFLAGAAMGASRPFTPRAWTMHRWGIAAAAVVAAAEVVIVWARVTDDGVPPTIELPAFLGLTFLLGFGLRNRGADACAAVLAAMTLVPAVVSAAFGPPRSPWSLSPDPGDPGLYAGWLALLAMLLVARRGRWTPALPFAICLILWHESLAWDFWGLRNLTTKDQVGFAEIFLVAAASVLLPVIAGRAAAALERNDHADAAARLVVRVQRDSWRTAIGAVLVGTAFLRCVEVPSVASLAVVLAGMACLAHCVAGPSLAALAPWTAAVVISVPLSVAFQEPLKPHFVELTVLPEAVVVLYVPLLVGAVVAGTRALRWPWWGWAAVVIAAAAQAVGMSHSIWPGDWSRGAYLIWEASWCVVVSLVVHAVATTTVRPSVVLAASPLVSVLVIEVFYGTRSLGSGWIQHSPVVAALLAGPAAALLALAARRMRSMTAVPADHPSFELPAASARGLVPAPNP